MDIYVRTRGSSLDYRFLGEAPSNYWWREYRDWTDTEGPTILLESDQAAWRIYIAGIHSARRDLSERPIQFNLALTGPHAQTDQQARGVALRVLTRSLTGLAAQLGQAIPGTELDGQLPENVVEPMLTESGAVTWNEAAAAVRAAYPRKPGSAGSANRAAAATDSGWTGGLLNQAARDQFLASATGLLSGQTGRALVLNLLSSAGDAAEFAAAGSPGGSLAILTARSGAPLDQEVTTLTAKKALAQDNLQPDQGPGPLPVSRKWHPHRPVTLRTALPAGLALLLVLAIGAVLAIRALTLSPAQPTPAGHPTHALSPSPTPTPIRSSSPKPSSPAAT